MQTKLKTTGDLRTFLVETMEKVRAGSTTADEASRIAKLAAQVNESFYSEIKIARTQREANLPVTELGILPIGMPEKGE